MRPRPDILFCLPGVLHLAEAKVGKTFISLRCFRHFLRLRLQFGAKWPVLVFLRRGFPENSARRSEFRGSTAKFSAVLVNNISRREIYIARREINIARRDIYISRRGIYFMRSLGIFSRLMEGFPSVKTDILSHFVSAEGLEWLLARLLFLVRAAGQTMQPAGVKTSAKVRPIG